MPRPRLAADAAHDRAQIEGFRYFLREIAGGQVGSRAELHRRMETPRAKKWKLRPSDPRFAAEEYLSPGDWRHRLTDPALADIVVHLFDLRRDALAHVEKAGRAPIGFYACHARALAGGAGSITDQRVDSPPISELEILSLVLFEPRLAERIDERLARFPYWSRSRLGALRVQLEPVFEVIRQTLLLERATHLREYFGHESEAAISAGIEAIPDPHLREELRAHYRAFKDARAAHRRPSASP